MPRPAPDPGENYKLIKKLGSGRWKTAYSARAVGHPTDVALLCFHSATPDDIAVDAGAFLRVAKPHKYRAYLAERSVRPNAPAGKRGRVGRSHAPPSQASHSVPLLQQLA